MIQLIGFLLCVYMFVRGLDIRSQIEDRKPGRPQSEAKWASIIAIAASILFFLLLIGQGSSMPSPT
jgi:hypothetical protein